MEPDFVAQTLLSVLLLNPLPACVHIAPIAAHKAEKGESKFLRQLDGKRRRRADGDKDWNPRHDALLHDLERRPSADDEDVGSRVVNEERSDHFVDGVVASDVFAYTQERAVAREGGGAVNRAGGVERALVCAENIRQREKQVCGDANVIVERFGIHAQCVDRGFAADAARRSRDPRSRLNDRGAAPD